MNGNEGKGPVRPTPELPALTPTQFDLGKELREEVEDAVKVGEEEAQQVHEVLEQFKKGVEKTLSKDDVAAHHDLGMAYMQMGLVDEAVRELNISKKAEKRRAAGRQSSVKKRPAKKLKAAAKKKPPKRKLPVSRGKSAAKKAAKKPMKKKPVAKKKPVKRNKK